MCKLFNAMRSSLVGDGYVMLYFMGGKLRSTVIKIDSLNLKGKQIKLKRLSDSGGLVTLNL